ncbi:hypothetical protein ACA910_009647 [Epithemia clementina (nom. ined.)]
MDEEEINDLYSDGMLFKQDELKVPLDEETLESEASTKHFVPKLESELADATTPTKSAWAAGLGASIRSPPLMVPKDMGSNMSDTNFRLAASFNIKELHNAQISLRQELFRSMTASQRQLEFVAALTDKVIVLAGLVGVPDSNTEVPSVWQAITGLKNQMSHLATHVGATVHGLQAATTAKVNGPLLEAEIRDVRKHLEHIEAMVGKMRTNVKRSQDIATSADLRTLDLERTIAEGARCKLFLHLHKMEPLLMRTQHFLDRVLPWFLATAPSGKVQVNRMAYDPFGDGRKGDHATGLAGPQAQIL